MTAQQRRCHAANCSSTDTPAVVGAGLQLIEFQADEAMGAVSSNDDVTIIASVP